MSSLLKIEKFLWSVVVWTVSPDSDGTDALVSWFCNNSPHMYTNMQNCAQERTLRYKG